MMHSVDLITHNDEFDVPLTYADCYFLKALLCYQKRYV
ncbi:hypothetical protein FEM08_11640 [Flavobacterium gilvum]|nr:hypothetical protein FEM08_11640 [Flavobacterium gilvum]